jgi:hypothetical protein
LRVSRQAFSEHVAFLVHLTEPLLQMPRELVHLAMAGRSPDRDHEDPEGGAWPGTPGSETLHAYGHKQPDPQKGERTKVIARTGGSRRNSAYHIYVIRWEDGCRMRFEGAGLAYDLVAITAYGGVRSRTVA